MYHILEVSAPACRALSKKQCLCGVFGKPFQHPTRLPTSRSLRVCQARRVLQLCSHSHPHYCKACLLPELHPRKLNQAFGGLLHDGACKCKPIFSTLKNNCCSVRVEEVFVISLLPKIGATSRALSVCFWQLGRSAAAATRSIPARG